jgi:hypothetical protein
VSEMIMGENYERNITLIRSDISRFSRALVEGSAPEWGSSQLIESINSIAFVGTNPTGELITSRFPVIRPESVVMVLLATKKVHPAEQIGKARVGA